MALELAPRESMAITLADSFLNDLDELEEDAAREEDEAPTTVSTSGEKAKRQDGDDIAADLDDLDEMDDDDDDDEEEENLEAVLSGMHDQSGVQGKKKTTATNTKTAAAPGTLSTKGGDSNAHGADDDPLAGVAKLRRSDRYRRHMALVAKYSAVEASEATLRAEENNEEYRLVVESNELLARAEAEILTVHRYVADLYATKFPELETLVPQPLDYVRVVDAMRNETDMTRLDLSDLLPPTVVMVVSVTGSTTSGVPLTETDLEACVRGCAECVALEQDKAAVLSYLESRMAVLAPNLTVLVGSSLAAMLVGMAGGLEALAAVPAANLVVMGQAKGGQRGDLGGFGNAVQMPHTGVLFFTDLVQAAPAPLRRKCLKLVAAKASLAVRVDAFGGGSEKTSVDDSSQKKTTRDTSSGFAFREEIKAKIEKLCEPPKARQVKALPAPDILAGKKKRGGKRVRKLKDKLRMTEMRSLANKRAFAHDFGTEYGDDSMGVDFGLLGKEGGSLRAPPQKESKSKTPSGAAAQHQAQHKKRKMIQMSSGATNGLSSSLVFTPVQGIELADPTAAQAKVDAANAKWFNRTSGFQSALPSSTAGPSGAGGLTV